jgi:hypothetical protein
MKIKSSFLILVPIFLGSLGAGAAAGFLAYKFGSQSLEAIKSPPQSPAQKLPLDNPSAQKSSQGFQIISEKDILVKVYDYVHAQKEARKNKSVNQQSSTSKEETIPQDSPPKSEQKSFLPLRGQDRGVTMEVTDINEQQDSLLLTVNLKNNGQETVKFLYSFLDIKDEQNVSISAIATGLPTELPANGQNFSGQISIPLSLLNDSKKISLSLPDYPEQNLLLQIPAIPILR